MIDVRCLQMRWRWQGSRMLGTEGRRYRWWSVKGDGDGGLQKEMEMVVWELW